VNIYWSADGASWGDLYDAPDSGAQSAEETGKAGYFRICQRDLAGNDILPYSNVVHSDGLPATVPAIGLTSDGHGHLTWALNFTSPYDSINIYQSDDGVTWGTDPFDGWNLSAGNRDCSGSAGYFRICICDWDGFDVLPYSNVVHSDGLTGPRVAIALNGSMLAITVTGTFPDPTMTLWWNGAGPTPLVEMDDVPASQTSYDLTGQAPGWYFIGKINAGDGSPGLPMSNGVYYPG